MITFIVLGTAHCADMYPSSDTDISDLKAARSRILTILQSWLQKGKPKSKKFEVQIEYMYGSNSANKINPKFFYEI